MTSDPSDSASPRSNPAPGWARGLLGALDAALLASLGLMPAIWLAAPLRLTGLELPWHPAWLALPLGLLALRLAGKAVMSRRWAGMRGLAEFPLYKKLCLLLIVPFVLFVGIEQALQAVGFEAHQPPVIVQGDGAAPDESSAGLIHCDEYRWRFVPGVVWRGRTVNRLGYLDREVSERKAPGTVRVICMGDSITAQGVPPYSGRLHRLLQEDPPDGRPWEAFNMAVHGYSSVIGLRLFQRRGRMLEPDVVTLYYGWNDHWWGGRMPDRVRMGVRMSPWRAGVYGVLKKKRFGQWVLSRMPAERPQVFAREEGYLRVPPDEYADTLTRFVADIRAVGAIPVLITAPRTERPSELLVRRGNAASVEDIIRLHDQYIDLTRQVARDTGADLLDLAERFENFDKKALMQADGIHMTGAGLDRIAELLHEKLKEISCNRPD